MLLRNLKIHSFHLIPVLLAFGCAQHSKVDVKAGTAAPTPTSSSGVTAGTQTSSGTDKDELNKQGQSIETHTYADACDLANSKRKKTLIEALSKEVSIPKERITLSQGWLNDEKIEIPGESEWVNRRRSWARSEMMYNDTKTDKSKKDRADLALQGLVKNLLWDDTLRVKASANFGIHKDNINSLPLLQEKLEACFKNESCGSIAFDEAELQTAKSISLYDHFLRKIDEAKTLSEKRQVITRLRGYMMIDAINRVPRRNNTVQVSRQEDKIIYNVPIDANSLTASDREKLKIIAESTWKDARHQVAIEWSSREKNKDIYQLTLHSEVGPRSYTYVPQRQVHLYSGSYAKSFAHQVGQVMGLPETQYTLWNAEQCEYTDQLNVKDLMSFAPTGEVLESSWSDLEKLYPEAEVK